jgi:hypothetical protein
VTTAAGRRWTLSRRAVLSGAVGACVGLACAAVVASSPPAAWGVLLYGAPVGVLIGAVSGLVVWGGAGALYRLGRRIAPLVGWALSAAFAIAVSVVVSAGALSGLESTVVATMVVAVAAVATAGAVLENLHA